MCSIRSGTTGIPRFMARSTSRRICADSFALLEKIRTITRQVSSALMMAAAHAVPGRTSRGAIQQRMPAASSAAQVASAGVLSGEE
jgi:hypothetical protein